MPRFLTALERICVLYGCIKKRPDRMYCLAWALHEISLDLEKKKSSEMARRVFAFKCAILLCDSVYMVHTYGQQFTLHKEGSP